MTETAEELQDLLARCALKDQKAFEALYGKTSAKLNGVAYRVMRDIDSANEILQEAFIQIWNRAGDYRADLAEPFTWMASIVRYRAYDKIRAEKRRIEGSSLRADMQELDNIPNKNTNESIFCDVSGQLTDCLQKLDTMQHKAILMAYYYGFSRDEISTEFDAPVNTVKSWLRRGLARLQQCLSN